MKYSFSFLPGWLVASLFLVGCGKQVGSPNEKFDSKPLFTLLDSTTTGVGFVNSIQDKPDFNILTYRNFYNGGGVAIGDINNDSLPDLYFTSNQHANKLYLNKGKMTFEDITLNAGVSGVMDWSTGVTMADVNNDGWLDIYVCNSGDVNGGDRENELFINNGDLTFTERAKEYNLNDEGYSTHAAFFDYDLDGDLDCYILNNSFRDPAKIELYTKMRERPSPAGNKLMRNDNGKFTDVTIESGIFSSVIGFGLGVSVSDINNDQLPDIYISNDFWERDYLYINKGAGKFSEELSSRLNYSSLSSMGSDIADLNGDGHPEIFTTDMLPGSNERLKTTISFDPYHLEDAKYRANFHYQMLQNCLQLNDGTGNFQEIGLLAGVAATDWSWGALIFDFENDGNRDIFVSNGILRDIMSMDFREFLADYERSHGIEKFQEGLLDVIGKLPSRKLSNHAFQLDASLSYLDNARKLGLDQPSFSNGSAYGDLDNDGDLDLVTNNINHPCFIYQNNASAQTNHFLKVRLHGIERNPFGVGAKLKLKVKEKLMVLENFNTRGFQSSVEPNLLFGLGSAEVIDTLEVTWPDGRVEQKLAVQVNQTLMLDYVDAIEKAPKSIHVSSPLYEDVSATLKGDATHHENRNNDFDDEILLIRMLSTEGPRIIKGDVNGDQLEDFVLLGAAGDADKLFTQSANGNFVLKTNPALMPDRAYESTCGALFDYDGDADLDLMIGSGGNEPEFPKENFLVRLYKNDGTGIFKPFPAGIPQLIGNFSTLEASDYDGDGDVDVFLGARVVPGNYGLSAQSYLLNNYNGQWMNVSPPELSNVGMVTDGVWADVDHDNDQDLVVVGDWMPVTVFVNDNGVIEKSYSVSGTKGWWNRIEASDLDSDGDIDFVLGNWGLNSKFKASAAKPLILNVNDFDNNGKSEFILSWYPPFDTIAYPFATKMELVSQLPGLRKSILKYADYEPKTYETLFPADVRRSSITYEAENLESLVLWNEESKLVIGELPIEAQFTAVFGILAEDLDSDGIKDIWLGGNFYALKPQVGRMDAGKGLFLKGLGNHKFKTIEASGLDVKGEVRDVVKAMSGGSSRIIVARNNASVKVFAPRKLQK